MKKSFLLLAFFVAALTASAQTSQGNFMLGGGFNYSTEKVNNTDNSRNEFGFRPSFGYFVADNFAVGINLDFSSEKAYNDLKSSRIAVGPFARYYMFTSNDRFAFFGEAGFLFGSGTREVGAGLDDVKSSEFTFYVAPGFSYFFNEHWALDFQLRGIYLNTEDPNKDADNDKRTRFGFGVDSFNPTLGFRYIIGN